MKRALAIALTLALVITGTARATTLLSDTFTGTNGTRLNAHTMDVGAGWTELAGTWNIQSNAAAKATNAADNQNAAVADAGQANCVASVTLTFPGSGGIGAGIIFNAVDNNNYWLVGTNGTTGWVLYQKVSGSYNVITTETAVPPANGSTVTLTVNTNGDNVVVSVGATTIFVQKIAGRGFETATKFGLYNYSGSDTGTTYDNFQVTDNPTPPTVTWFTQSAANGTVDVSVPGQYTVTTPANADAASVSSDGYLGFFHFSCQHKITAGSGSGVFVSATGETVPNNTVKWGVLVSDNGAGTVTVQYVNASLAGITVGTAPVTVGAFYGIDVLWQLGLVTVTITSGSTTTLTVDPALFDNSIRVNTTGCKIVLGDPQTGFTAATSVFKSLTLTRTPTNSYHDFTVPDTLTTSPLDTGVESTNALYAYLLLNSRRDVTAPVGIFSRYTLAAGSSTYAGVYTWDSYWAAIVLRYIGARTFARGIWLTMFDNQDVSGAVPQFIQSTGVLEPVAGQKFTQPYVAQACYLLSDDGNYSWFDYTKLQAHISYWENNKKSARGLFVITEGREGWDGFISVNPSQTNPGPLNKYEWIGHDCQMYREYLAMAQIASHLGHSGDAASYANKAAALKTLIQTTAWNPATSWFNAYDTVGNAFVTNYQADAVYALYAGVATAAQAAAIRNRLMDSTHFYRTYGITSLDITDAHYVADSSVTLFNTNWNGPIWLPVQYMAVIGLQNYGYTADAQAVAAKMLTLYNVDPTSTLREYENPDTGARYGVSPFYGWDGMGALASYQQSLAAFPTNIPLYVAPTPNGNNHIGLDLGIGLSAVFAPPPYLTTTPSGVKTARAVTN